MLASTSSAPAKPARTPTLLVVGCGDVGMRVLKHVHARWRVLALTSSPARVATLRAAGALPVLGNLDEPGSLARLKAVAATADVVLHLAPPTSAGPVDLRTRALLQVLLQVAQQV